MVFCYVLQKSVFVNVKKNTFRSYIVLLGFDLNIKVNIRHFINNFKGFIPFSERRLSHFLEMNEKESIEVKGISIELNYKMNT